VAAPCRPASAQVNFKQSVAFGDSLTHNDILGYVYKTPREWYGEDPFEAVFRRGARRGDVLMSYAIAGSDSQDLYLQLFLFYHARKSGRQRRPTLINFEVGANDVFGHERLLATHPPGASAAADAVVDGVLDRTYQALLWLWMSNRQSQFIVWTVPDVTVSPGLVVAYSEGERANIRGHIRRINAYIQRLEEVPQFAVADIFARSRELVTAPPVIQGHALPTPPAHGGAGHLYADPTHPSAVGNRFIANTIIQGLNRRWGAGIPGYSEAEVAALAGIR